jgi:integrase
VSGGAGFGTSTTERSTRSSKRSGGAGRGAACDGPRQPFPRHLAHSSRYLREIAEGKGPADRLFGRHWRDWPREWVQRICRAAKVPEVTAHGMRGLHGTLAVERGATTHVVAQALDHESETTSRKSYISREAITGADQRRVLAVLAGGRQSGSLRAHRASTSRSGNDSQNIVYRGALRRRK